MVYGRQRAQLPLRMATPAQRNHSMKGWSIASAAYMGGREHAWDKRSRGSFHQGQLTLQSNTANSISGQVLQNGNETFRAHVHFTESRDASAPHSGLALASRLSHEVRTVHQHVP